MVQTASFRRVHRPTAVCLVVDGEIDSESVPEFTAAIFDVIIVADKATVLDLTGVTFFGSEAIGCLITGQALANDHGIALVIEPSRIVRRVLEVVGMADYFELRATV
jgi:anti-sigma B factor antagonist